MRRALPAGGDDVSIRYLVIIELDDPDPQRYAEVVDLENPDITEAIRAAMGWVPGRWAADRVSITVERVTARSIYAKPTEPANR